MKKVLFIAIVSLNLFTLLSINVYQSKIKQDWSLQNIACAQVSGYEYVNPNDVYKDNSKVDYQKTTFVYNGPFWGHSGTATTTKWSCCEQDNNSCLKICSFE